MNSFVPSDEGYEVQVRTSPTAPWVHVPVQDDGAYQNCFRTAAAHTAQFRRIIYRKHGGVIDGWHGTLHVIDETENRAVAKMGPD
jgi:hypothetical protein